MDKLRVRLHRETPIGDEFMYKVEKKEFIWGWHPNGYIWAKTQEEALKRAELKNRWTYND